MKRKASEEPKRPKREPVVATKAYVDRLIAYHAEDKIFDSAQGQIGISNAGTFVDLTDIQQGTGITQRLGNQIYVKKISYNLKFTRADSDNTLRVMLLKWMEGSAINPPATNQVLDGVGIFAPADTPFYQLNWVNLKQGWFKVIQDYRVNVDGIKANVYINKSSTVTRPNQKVNYRLNGAQDGTGKFYLYLVSDSTAIAHPVVTLYTRTVFEDS